MWILNTFSKPARPTGMIVCRRTQRATPSSSSTYGNTNGTYVELTVVCRLRSHRTPIRKPILLILQRMSPLKFLSRDAKRDKYLYFLAPETAQTNLDFHRAYKMYATRTTCMQTIGGVHMSFAHNRRSKTHFPPLHTSPRRPAQCIGLRDIDFLKTFPQLENGKLLTRHIGFCLEVNVSDTK